METLTISDNFRIKIIADTPPENPFTSWDGCVPTMYESYSWNGNSQDFSNGEIENYIQSVYTDNVIKRYQKKIAQIFELNLEGLTPDEKYTEINDCFYNANISQLAELCELKKIPYLNWDSKGYCQGDLVNVLSVITPKFLEITGCNIRNAETILNGDRKLFDSWMWYGAYSFTVYYYEAGKYDEYGDLKSYYEEAEEIDSCGGFYGIDCKTNGMLDEINIEGLSKEEILQLLEEGFNNVIY